MKTGPLWFCAAMLLAAASTGRGIINPNFTPKDLVDQSDVVAAGTLAAGAAANGAQAGMEWKLTPTHQVKGKLAGEQTLSLARCKKDHVEEVGRLLTGCAKGKTPVMLFSAKAKDERRAYVHAGGGWLDAQPGKAGLWDITGQAPQMTGTYAGGTDMLLGMSQYLAGDPGAFVPVGAGVRWMEHAKVAQVAGEITGLAAVEAPDAEKPQGSLPRVRLFVASAGGDRLLAPKKDGEGFQDVTAKAGLDTKSRRFVWTDLNGDGLVDLVSWDGTAITVRLAQRGGTFKPGGAGWAFKPSECIGLAACSLDGRAGVLVSTGGLPVLLTAEAKGWKAAAMPDGPALKARAGRCPVAAIVADLDNDGCVDVLCPGDRDGVLWKGKAGGFQPPVVTNVAAGPGGAVAALGDFDANGALDIFLAGKERNSLWENDGKARFTEVLGHSGSLSYKCPHQAADAKVMDLNHDGWQDLCVVYKASDLLYHFNRGFRAFGEEGQVRLPGLEAEAGAERVGQRAVAAADFNADGSLDLAVAHTNGQVCCYYNDALEKPILRVGLKPGLPGPVTVTLWQGAAPGKTPLCLGARSVHGSRPGACFCLRQAGEYTLKWALPGKGDLTRTVKVPAKVPEGGLGVTLEPPT